MGDSLFTNPAAANKSETGSGGRVATETTGKVMEEHLYKILIVGEFGVGKTSIIRRYTEGSFSPNYKLTIGVDFALKSIRWDTNTKVNLQLWDIAGHERFGHMTRVYYKYAVAAIIVFDLTRQSTWEAVTKWYNDVNDKVLLSDGQPVPVLLLANKVDIMEPMTEGEFSADQLDMFCSTHGMLGWFYTSARDNLNIEEAMTYLVDNILIMTRPINRTRITDNSNNANSLSITGKRQPVRPSKEVKSGCGC